MTRLLALALLVGLVGTASAQTRPLPPSRSLTTTHTGAIEPECFRELLGASREWAEFDEPVNVRTASRFTAVTLIHLEDLRTSAEKLRAEADTLERKGLAQSRWRKAVEACK